MRHAHRVVGKAELDVDDVTLHLTLDLEGRRKRRQVVRAREGVDVLIDLEAAPALADGDGLALTDGGIARVEAEPEALTAVTGEDAQHLVRLAWHLGNRHLPVQFAGGALLIRRDRVIEAMLEGLGARCAPVEAPFEPESGAYTPHNRHGHDDGR